MPLPFPSPEEMWTTALNETGSTPQPPEPEATDSVQSQVPSDLPAMVPLSVAEIRWLFFRLVDKRPLSFAYSLAWSFWQRAHQALAQLCHYKRRSTIASHLQL